MSHGLGTQRGRRATSSQPSLKPLAILEALAWNPRGAALNELVASTGLNKTTVLRILHELVSEGYARRDDGTKRYFLGYRLLGLSAELLDNLDVRRVARPHLEQLVSETGETVHLVQLDGTECVYIDKVNCPQPVGLHSNIGKRRPLHCTGVGKVLLAFSAESVFDDVLYGPGLPEFTSTTITDPERLRCELECIRERGFALDNAEHREGITCVAGPIMDADGALTAGLSVAGPTFRFPLDVAEQSASLVLRTCQEISEALGFRGVLRGLA